VPPRDPEEGDQKKAKSSSSTFTTSTTRHNAPAPASDVTARAVPPRDPEEGDQLDESPALGRRAPKKPKKPKKKVDCGPVNSDCNVVAAKESTGKND
jgi:hypothetical protein